MSPIQVPVARCCAANFYSLEYPASAYSPCCASRICLKMLGENHRTLNQPVKPYCLIPKLAPVPSSAIEPVPNSGLTLPRVDLQHFTGLTGR